MPKIDRDESGGLISFRAPTDLIARIDAMAATEGISRSDVARRAAMQAVRTHRAANAQIEGAD